MHFMSANYHRHAESPEVSANCDQFGATVTFMTPYANLKISGDDADHLRQILVDALTRLAQAEAEQAEPIKDDPFLPAKVSDETLAVGELLSDMQAMAEEVSERR